MFTGMPVVEGVVGRPNARPFRDDLAEDELMELRPPVLGIGNRSNRQIAKAEAERPVELDVSFGAPCWQGRAWNPLTHLGLRVAEDS
jgi:hypothetical protein